MSNILTKANAKFKKEGIMAVASSGVKMVLNNLVFPLLGAVYRKSIRRILPESSYITRNGIRVSEAKAFDNHLPKQFHPNPSHKPRYKQGNIALLRSSLSDADDVVVIGGGYGVTTIHAARCIGPDGFVHSYEGGRKQAEIIKQATKLNDVEDRVQVHHAVVGPADGVYSWAGDANIVDPVDLPDCDLLEMDCEGAELEILRGIELKPATLIVEIHPHKHGGDPESVLVTLDEMGYSVKDRRDQNGMELTHDQLLDLLHLDRAVFDTTRWGGKHPPVVKAVK